MLKATPQARTHALIIPRVAAHIRAAINPTDLLQVLLNLTMNAVQADTTPHRVEISVEPAVGHPKFLQTPGDCDRWMIGRKNVNMIIDATDGESLAFLVFDHAKNVLKSSSRYRSRIIARRPRVEKIM